MNKEELLKKYNEEDKLLISKILDKLKYMKEKSKVTNTDFLNMHEQKIASEILKRLKEERYIFYGGFQEAERKILIFYPEKLVSVFEKDIPNIEKIIKVIRIELTNEMDGKYLHKNYLSGIMKLGIKREKVGDIIVENDGADIFVLSDVLKFLIEELKNLKRFSKSNIEEVPLNDVREQKLEKEDVKIIIPSLRLDSVVAELVNSSRNKATQIVKSERVFLNYTCETKTSKEVKIGDVITVRGKGRFVIKEFIGNSRKNKKIILIEKFKS